MTLFTHSVNFVSLSIYIPEEEEEDMPLKLHFFSLNNSLKWLKKMGENGTFISRKLYLYSLYLAMDSGKLSFRTVEYIFNLRFSEDLASIKMKEWIDADGGLSMGMIVSAFMISITVAYHSDKNSKNPLKRLNATLTPYLRDICKSLLGAKNSTAFIAHLLNVFKIKDVRYLVFPLGLVIGVLFVLNQTLIRYRSNTLKEINAQNELLLSELNVRQEFNAEDIGKIRHILANKLQQLSKLAILGAAFSGFIDGLDPGVGLLVLSTLPPPMLVTVITFCALYFFANFFGKIYAEINAQSQLKISLKKIKLSLVELEKSPEGALNPDNIRNIRDELALTVNVPVGLRSVQNGVSAYDYVSTILGVIKLLSPNLIKLFSFHRAVIGLTTMGSASVGSLLTSTKAQKTYTSNPNLLFTQPSKKTQVIPTEVSDLANLGDVSPCLI